MTERWKQALIGGGGIAFLFIGGVVGMAVFGDRARESITFENASRKPITVAYVCRGSEDNETHSESILPRDQIKVPIEGYREVEISVITYGNDGTKKQAITWQRSNKKRHLKYLKTGSFQWE